MNLDVEKTKPAVINALRIELKKEMIGGNIHEQVDQEEHIDGMIFLLFLIKDKNKVIIKLLRKHGLLKDNEAISTFEKSIQSIAKSDQVEKITQPDKEKKKKWMTTKLSSYLSHILPTEGEKTGVVIAKNLYDKYKNILVCKLKRVNSSPKVLELAQKHPNIDINRLVSLCVLEDKLELANDDLLWLDRMITIIQEPKALKPAIST
ncbi:MAG: hypothetical protein WCW84_11720 [Sulfurimonas sp.]